MLKNYIIIIRDLPNELLERIKLELKLIVSEENTIDIADEIWLVSTEMSAKTISMNLMEVLDNSDDLIIFELGEDYFLNTDSRIGGFVRFRF